MKPKIMYIEQKNGWQPTARRSRIIDYSRSYIFQNWKKYLLPGENLPSMERQKDGQDNRTAMPYFVEEITEWRDAELKKINDGYAALCELLI